MKSQAPYLPGRMVGEGKTKRIYEVQGTPEAVIIVSKDDITAGDGAKHDVIPGKGVWATTTTCSVFALLKSCGIPVAFGEQIDDRSFLAAHCRMLPYEVVVRREAHGSYLKRNPYLAKGQIFPKLLLEFFLKTSGKKWKGHNLPCDDPLMLHVPEKREVHLFDPAKPIHGQEPFLVLSEEGVFTNESSRTFALMEERALETFLILEKAWQIEGGRLVDFKVEFGLDSDGNLRLADVIDNDSWRVIEDGAYVDKQVYRDGGALDKVAAKYHHVAEVTSRFRLPRQRIILWCGSEKDKIDPFIEALDDRATDWVPDKKQVLQVQPVICSVHKEPEVAALELRRLIQEVPDSVVIAYIGRSNGAGPTLSAMSTTPVITVPASMKDFPDDVWSSLRSPSNVPVMTVLEPANAVLAALNILSARNPLIYAHLRAELEERMVNTVQLI